jgi:hypothetical protein
VICVYFLIFTSYLLFIYVSLTIISYDSIILRNLSSVVFFYDANKEVGMIQTRKLSSSEIRVSIIKILCISYLFCFNLSQLTVPTAAVFKDTHKVSGVIKAGTWTNSLSDKSEKSKFLPPSRETKPKAPAPPTSSNPSYIDEQQRSNSNQKHTSDYSKAENKSTENRNEKDLSEPPP